MTDHDLTSGAKSLAAACREMSLIVETVDGLDPYAADAAPWRLVWDRCGEAIEHLEQARECFDAACGGTFNPAVRPKGIGEVVSFVGAMLQGGQPAADAMRGHADRQATQAADRAALGPGDGGQRGRAWLVGEGDDGDDGDRRGGA